jgi:hypothetical protein
MAKDTKETPEELAVDTTKADQAAELRRQKDVTDAVHGATHDKDGNPIPVVVPPGPVA